MAKVWTYVSYVEHCSPRLKRFKSERVATKWVESFLLKHSGNADFSFNFMITGSLVAATPYYGGTAREDYKTPRV